MKDTILIITSSFDQTCDYLISKFEKIDFFRFNMDYFSTYKISISADRFSISNQYREVNSENCKAIYFRKPTREDLSGIYETKYHDFAYKECYSIIEGLAEYFPGRCLSRPSIMRKAGNKIYQALIAKEVGLKIPPLMITNDKKSVDLITSQTSIVKPLATGAIIERNEKEYVQTNLFISRYDLSTLNYTPSYFQQYMKKDYEVRATFVGRKEFTVRIDSTDQIDWRRAGNNISYKISSLPKSVYESCLRLLEKSNMEFGCFDFIVNEDEWYFLEMNSNGQWAWLEFETGLSISEEIIGYLNA